MVVGEGGKGVGSTASSSSITGVVVVVVRCYLCNGSTACGAPRGAPAVTGTRDTAGTPRRVRPVREAPGEQAALHVPPVRTARCGWHTEPRVSLASTVERPLGSTCQLTPRLSKTSRSFSWLGLEIGFDPEQPDLRDARVHVHRSGRGQAPGMERFDFNQPGLHLSGRP